MQYYVIKTDHGYLTDYEYSLRFSDDIMDAKTFNESYIHSYNGNELLETIKMRYPDHNHNPRYVPVKMIEM
jgi:hypothetical protein